MEGQHGGNQLRRDVLMDGHGQGHFQIAPMTEHAVEAADVGHQADDHHRDDADERQQPDQAAQQRIERKARKVKSLRGRADHQRGNHAQNRHAQTDGEEGMRSIFQLIFNQFAQHLKTSLKYSSTLHPFSSRSSSTL